MVWDYARKESEIKHYLGSKHIFFVRSFDITVIAFYNFIYAHDTETMASGLGRDVCAADFSYIIIR